MMRKKNLYAIFLFIIIFQKLSLKCDIIQPGLNTITTSGRYALAADTAGYLVIDADKVVIDLHNYTLSNLSTQAVIEVVAGHKNIEIKNGKIKGAVDQSNDGILVGNNNQLIVLENLKTFSCRYGLNFQGTSNLIIKSCRAQNCEFSACQKGVYLNYTKKMLFQNCEAFNCLYAGFEQNNCMYNCFDKCSALETSNNSGAADAIGFSSFMGQGNLFNACVAEGTAKTAGSWSTRAIGFLLAGTQGAMENDSKIINSVANTTYSATSNCRAFGVALDPILKSETLAQDFLAPYVHGNTIRSVSWSPCGKYLAIGGSAGTETGLPQVVVLKLETTAFSFIASYIHGGVGVVVNSVNWSPNGKYLAIGGAAGTGGYQVRVLKFDGSNLTLLTGCNYAYNDSITSVNWSPNGKYLAIGTFGSLTTSYQTQVLVFDGISLSVLTGCNYSHGALGIFGVDWSPDGKYLAIGGITGTGGYSIRVLKFDGTNLTVLTGCNYIYASTVQSVNWSPDGKYLAIGGMAAGSCVRVLQFDGASITTDIVYSNPDTTANAVNWSNDGRYLSVGYDGTSTGIQTRILNFNGSSLSLVKSYGDTSIIYSVSWSPDCVYLAAGGVVDGSGYEVKSFEVMQAPYDCLIQNNKVCDSTSYLSANGGFSRQAIGISGSGNNLYIKNVVSYNDVNFNSAVYNVYGGSLLACDPKQFDNISQPPYEATYGYSTCF